MFGAGLIAALATVLWVYLKVQVSAVFGAGQGIVSVIGDLLARSEDSAPRTLLAPAQRSVRSWGWLTVPAVWMLPARMDQGLFAWSAMLIDPAAAGVVFWIWPVLLMLMLAARRSAAEPLGIAGRAAAAAVTAGLALVVLGQAGMPEDWGADTARIAAGTAIAVATAAAVAVYVTLNMVWADRLASLQPRSAPGSKLSSRERMWWVLLVHAAMTTIGAPAGVGLSALTFGGATAAAGWQSAAAGAASGMLLVAPATILLRVANVLNANPTVNLVYALGPVLTVLWLTPGGIAVNISWLFWVGAVTVAAAAALAQAPALGLFVRRQRRDVHTDDSADLSSKPATVGA